MTKKDYELIASSVKEAFKAVERARLEARDTKHALIAIHNVAWNLADNLESENPRFDRDKFFEACEIEG